MADAEKLANPFLTDAAGRQQHIKKFIAGISKLLFIWV